MSDVKEKRMLARGRIRPPWGLSITLSLLVLAAIVTSAALTARSLSRLVAAQAAVTNSMRIEGTLKDVLNAMLDAETGARGFLLTGRASYLQPYYDGMARVSKARDALDAALQEERADAVRLDALNKAIASKLQALTRVVGSKSEGRTQEAMDLVLSDVPEEAMQQVRAAAEALAADESRRTGQARAIHATEIVTTYWVLGGSITLNVILLVVLVWCMRLAAVKQGVARHEMASRNAELSRLLDAEAVNRQQAQASAALSQFLMSCADVDEAARVLQQQLPQLMQADSGALYLFAPSRNQLRQRALWGDLVLAEYFEPADCWGLRLGQPYRQAAEGGAPGCRHLEGVSLNAGTRVLCLPMLAHGDLLGLLVLKAAAPADPLTPDNDYFRRVTLEQVGLLLGNLQLRESLRQQSIRDELTGLYNRRFLEESARREVLRAARIHAQGGQTGLVLLMIDVDHFKRFNDQYGHEVGDQVLRAVGQTLQRITRDSDVAARYGGEEFTVVLTDTKGDFGIARAEEIRSEVEKMAIEALGKRVGEVTISIGLAQFPMHGSTVESLLRAADRALYSAKRAGRNRVMRAA